MEWMDVPISASFQIDVDGLDCDVVADDVAVAGAGAAVDACSRPR